MGEEMPKAAKKTSRSQKTRARGDSKSASSAPIARSRDGSDASRKPVVSSDREAQLAVEASDKLYYRIGEVSELTGVKAHVLRYWETEFRWMAPPKSRSKQRLYRKRDIAFVLLLKRLLWEERYTIAGARQRIQELGAEGALAMLDTPLERDRSPKDASTASTGDWAAFSVAIDEMRDELLGIRGVLHEIP